jgi:hypothetical protein
VTVRGATRLYVLHDDNVLDSSIRPVTNSTAAAATSSGRGGRLVEENSEVADMITMVSMIRAAALAPRASLELMRRIRLTQEYVSHLNGGVRL